MEKFIAKMIEKARKNGLESGMDKYIQYFGKTWVYEKYREKVNEELRDKGIWDCII